MPKKPSEMNVVITAMSRSAVSEIFGYVKWAHEQIYKELLEIKYEGSAFEATRVRRPLPLGWYLAYNADPSLLIKRGYDKIIYISRDLISLCKAHAEYYRNTKTPDQIVRLILKEPDFFSNIEKKWKILEKPVEDPNFLKISLEDWNNFTFQTYNKMLDFLEFPKNNRPIIAPVKVDRNFEGYSCSFLPIESKVSKRLEEIRSGSE